MADGEKKKRKPLAPAKPLSGFQDWLPEQALAFHEAVEAMTAVFRRYGYGPIDTPCIFLTETLAGEAGEINKQLYRWEQGSKDVALRFDLTVPLARYVAANEQKLSFPFKRYHLGKVWRGESVQKQRGRYREFYQLDFDIVGTDSATADLESILVINDALAALGLERFRIRLNDRLLLNGVLEGFSLVDKAEEVLRALDKIDKIGGEGVRKELADQAGLESVSIEAIMDYAELDRAQGSEAILAAIDDKFGGNAKVQRGLARLRFLLETARAVIPAERLEIDPAIARGLGYYTGPVFETVLDDYPDVGSVCSGGRYDDLASSYTRRELPGVGASVGLSRLLAAIADEGQALPRGTATVILSFPGVEPIEGVKLRAELHRAGLEAELYPQPPSALSKQSGPKPLFKYASRKGFRYAVVLGEAELAAGVVQLKDLDRAEQSEVARGALASKLQELLSQA